MFSTANKKQLFLDYILAGCLILLMGIFSVWANDIEIILPELAALSAGCFIYKKASWNSAPKALFILPSITAFLGFGINMLHISLALKVGLVLLLIFLLFYLSKNVLAPAIATGLLPIVTNCHSVYFLISTLLFTLILAVIVQLKYQSGEKIAKETVPFRTFFAYFSIITIWLSFCYYNNYSFMLAIPPVIVVGLEMISEPKIKLKPIFIKTFLLVASSLISSYIYLYIDNLLLILLVNFIVISTFLAFFNQKMAPAYAMALLPIVLKNKEPLYFSLYVFIICCAIFGGAYISKYMYNRFWNANRMK